MQISINYAAIRIFICKTEALEQGLSPANGLGQTEFIQQLSGFRQGSILTTVNSELDWESWVERSLVTKLGSLFLLYWKGSS